MRKLVESTFVTLDGVISSPQVWGSKYWDDQHLNYARTLLYDAEAMLLGRKTYEGFLSAWPGRTGEFADRFNGMPKFVVSRTLTTATWNTTVLSGDAAESVAALKRQPGGTIVKYGTGEVDRALIPNNLVDEFHFWFFPVLAGSGDRLIDQIALTHLKLLRSERFNSGIVVNVYEPT